MAVWSGATRAGETLVELVAATKFQGRRPNGEGDGALLGSHGRLMEYCPRTRMGASSSSLGMPNGKADRTERGGAVGGEGGRE